MNELMLFLGVVLFLIAMVIVPIAGPVCFLPGAVGAVLFILGRNGLQRISDDREMHTPADASLNE